MTRNLIRIPLTTAAGVAAVIALAACSSSGSGPADNNPGSTTAAPPVASSGQQPATAGKSVTATETEFHIALGAKTYTAGTYTFHVKNAGSITHALTVDGPGVQDKSTGDISPGASATLTVTLAKGSYEIYCPVGNHKMEGMDETVQVT